ncbi:phosphoribosyl transferase [Candidatus Nomurabacteria bacterium RIFCSPHIGHO2_02_FULL_41_52]|uniref:Phosphoribosyl transferase n=1 Tax=Candidatus Nomurabacteria bacterium RIFCSPLOWO2_12_FULL_41_10 TaxID=1801795 RepID=A0A1F6YD29_9BACT|nr:MAG: phosphoribosyl transferase [Candidatus Nomurabacteria bacterium RIFCSPHIGHO2_02_FULL_41_52]OGI84590.1 MAG: phosphoribosyl transferase [Candidatus Nomurabacteria bacterium RIFCSPHIGHO2_12_FULL_42_19]OGI98478.1 MAG: phosphoribosyl transferase [Candidatus Nomurabacteria bacterium RIFCSPLOWO2_02_FULL_42_24]OGJ04265.1 MAG: phosphoribosyl transferase [Candidatus Nomurabacteria bacterium RIFCSPLOWO2_12_FULL_41_10]
MMFKDRKEAGELLAEQLIQYRDTDAVVYALPRGGAVLGFEIAHFLHLPLDLVIARKIGHPDNPEYAVCAVTEEGEPFCDEAARAMLDPAWLEIEIKKEREEAKRRRKTYLKNQEHHSPKNKIAIVVDDGVATGLTLRAALHSLRKEQPKELLAAVPVAPHELVEILRAEADKVVILKDERKYLGAVGSYYQNFPQVSDEEVIELLEQNVLD